MKQASASFLSIQIIVIHTAADCESFVSIAGYKSTCSYQNAIRWVKNLQFEVLSTSFNPLPFVVTSLFY